MLKLVAQAFLVGGLQQARSKLAVHFYGEANNLFGQRIIFLAALPFVRPSLPHRLIVKN